MKFDNKEILIEYYFQNSLKLVDKQPLVSAIILNYNRSEATLKCIESLKTSSYPSLEVIVVDNCSKQESFDFLKENVKFLDVLLIRINKNIGYAGGNNVGIRNAKGNYLLILNDDVTVSSELVTGLSEIAQGDKTIGIVGPLTYYGKTNEVWAYPPTIAFSNHAVLDVPFVMGAAFMIKRDVIAKIGLLDENFFLYHEELDWCIRARNAGYRVVCAVNLKAWHHVPSLEVTKYSANEVYYVNRNYFIIAAKHFRSGGAWIGFLFKNIIYSKENKEFIFLFLPTALKNKKYTASKSYISAIVVGMVYFLKFMARDPLRYDIPFFGERMEYRS